MSSGDLNKGKRMVLEGTWVYLHMTLVSLHMYDASPILLEAVCIMTSNDRYSVSNPGGGHSLFESQ